MLVSQFNFDLPNELIARLPLESRSASRLLDLTPDGVVHRQFDALLDLLTPNDLLVFNDTKVVPARLTGHKQSGGKIELLLERLLSPTTCLVQIKASKAPKPGSYLSLADDNISVRVDERRDDLFVVTLLNCDDAMAQFKQFGQMPLPPYIDRAEQAIDVERYQTVYARNDGAVAAPTAGLHFDEAMMSALSKRDIAHCFVTLHVGAGTFQPVRAKTVAEHQMHSEQVCVSQAVVDAVQATRARGGRVVAVGTTSLRSLEAASQSGQLEPFTGFTDIFIYPGYQFKTVDALVTNFHLPGSTLLMLVTAFAGFEPVMSAYREAVQKKYRFFSYGDAMFLRRCGDSA